MVHDGLKYNPIVTVSLVICILRLLSVYIYIYTHTYVNILLFSSIMSVNMLNEI